jgi:hypothetical protein
MVSIYEEPGGWSAQENRRQVLPAAMKPKRGLSVQKGRPATGE